MNPSPRAPQARRDEPGCVAPERDRLLEALAGLEEVVYSMSPDARSVYFVGDACERVYGRPGSEFFANPALWEEVIHPQDRARVREGLYRLFAGVPFDDEYRILHPDGTIRWVHDRTTLVEDADGTPLRLNGIVSDVTERRQARERAAAAQERLNQALAAARAGAWEWDARSGDVRWSPGNFELMGYLPDAVAPSYEYWLAAVHPEDRASAEAEVRRVMETGADLDIRFRVRWPDGSVRWIQDVGRMLYDADGTPRGMYGIQIDVTERQHAESALRESEEQFRTLVATIPGAVYRSEVQPPYRDLFLSDGIQSITGYRASEYSEPGGPTCGDLILPEDRPRVEAVVNDALAAGTTFQVRYRIRHRDGSIRWVSEQGRPKYSPEGKPLYLEGVHIDVTAQMAAETALRESEERLRAIVENEPECVSLLDREGRILEMNAAGLRMLEAESLDQVQGTAVVGFLVPADAPAFRELIDAVFRGENRTLTFDVVGLKGTRRTCETHAIPMWEDARHLEVHALLNVTRDITEQKAGERIRRDLEHQLRESQKMEAVGTLAGGIAHDFNNIVASIMGNAELLGRILPPSGEAHRATSSILESAERARDLVRQILTFSRKRDEDRRPIALQPVLAEALGLLRSSLPATVAIETDIEEKGHVVLADAAQVRQVVVNLCANAAQAMPGGGTLSVSLRRVEVDDAFALVKPGLRPGPHMRLTVSDTGHGMDAATLGRIFEPFFTTRPQGEGTGLGLSVVHGIMRSHEGVVTATSAPGEGTTFDLYFPFPSRAAAPAGRGQHILVVDDEAPLVEIMTTALVGLGYHVSGHVSPVEALADLREDPTRYDLVVCDFTMPKMSGLEFAARLREIRADLPLVLTTGYGGALDADDIRRQGIREILEKPFRLDALGEVVHRHLASPPPP